MGILLQNSPTALKGIEELKTTIQYLEHLKKQEWQSELLVDFTLARGLNYYTGVIVEVGTSAVKMGSIGGGGRYDDLTGLFGLKGLSGVGVSFGIDRIYDVMEELSLFPHQLSEGAKVLLLLLDENGLERGLQYLSHLRNAGISCDMYADKAKFDKQMKYANKRNVPFVAILGTEELEKNTISMKNMQTGEQQTLTIEALIHHFS